MEPLAVAALILLALVVGVAALLGTRPGAVVARAVLRPLVRLVYAFRVEGGSLVPRTGGALLVANHVSYADAFLLGACVERPVRFLMHRSFLANPLVAAFARWVGAIPVAAGDTPQEREQALAAAARALTEGGLVAIFAEGRITRTGTLLGFRRGLETIARTAGAPIVPVALDEVWGSIFSYAGGRAVMKWPRRLPYRVRVAFGAPLPPDTPSHLVRDAIGELLARSAEQRALEEPDLARSFVRTARRHRRRVALVDERGEAVRYEQLLAASLALARTLRHALGEPRRVGVLLSPGRAAVEAHLALALAGRVVVAIDPALGTAGAVELVRRAGLSVVLGRREDARRLGLEGSAGSGGTRLLEVEDLRAEAARRHGGWARRRARRPAAWIEGRLSRLPAAADPAAVLVTSGTEAAARAVVLPHASVASNVRALAQVGEVVAQDRVLGVLPFSHALGHTVTLWTPLLTGARLVLADAAGDPQALLELVRTERPTLLVATPALFARWVELFAPEDLSDVRLAISGGEHLPLATAQAWQARFGRPLHEGYGATELGPVVAVDLPDVERGGLTQSNHAAGTVGRSLPGIAVRVVRDEDGTPCEPDEEGAVLVRGPNLMAGWLDEHGALVCRLREGWYDTADVGALDRDGFLVVVDRRERFVEHGDRRVALARIEDALRSGHPGRLARLAAVRVEQADGERVGIVHEPLDVLPQRLIELARAHLGSQAVLAERATWVEVPALPVLASGKLDLRALGRLLAAAVRCPDLR